MKQQDSEVRKFVSEQRAWLTEWHTPVEVIKRIDWIISFLRHKFRGRLHFLHDNNTLPFREMWVLARCAAMMNRPYVSLAPSTVSRPDGYSRGSGFEFGAEVTEAIEPGRKRRLENWKPGEWREDPGSEWIRRAELIPIALTNSLTRKKSIEYPSNTELFVYLNIGEYGIRQREIEDDIKGQLEAPLGPFNRIFVLWKDKLFASNGECWSLGEPSTIDLLDDHALWEEIVNSSDA